VYEWEISHCNDPLVLDGAETDTYAEIDKKGALLCHACPHSVGANCKHGDIQWDGIYANPGWWTDGTDKDTYYKCPFKGSCLGGRLVVSGNSSSSNATKSECKEGHEGVLCAICSGGYFLNDGQCTKCLPTGGAAETLVVLTNLGVFLGFLYVLTRQMKVRTAGSYWREIQAFHVKGGTRDHSNVDKSLQISTIRQNIKVGQKLGKAIKIFVSFAQIIGVYNSVYSIPWPPGFLDILSVFSILNFDFVAISGMECVMPYTFLDNFLYTICAPIAVMVFVFFAYLVGWSRHKAHYGNKFTRPMQSGYTNRVLQFIMWIVLVLYPPLSRKTIVFFSCSNDIDAHRYLNSDMRVECFAGRWNSLLVVAVVALCIYPVGVPLYFAWKLWSRRKRLEDSHVKARYGFLYEAYHPHSYMWDIWEMFRQLFLSGIMTLVEPGRIFQVIVASFANFWFMVFLLLKQPYLKGQVRKLAILTNVALTFSMNLGLILKAIPEAQNYLWFFDTLLISTNATVVVYAIKVIILPFCASCRKHAKATGRKGHKKMQKIVPAPPRNRLGSEGSSREEKVVTFWKN
jgi:hypothetical protein